MGRGYLNHFLASDHYVCRCHQGHCDSESADLSLAMNCRQGHTHLTAKPTAGSLRSLGQALAPLPIKLSSGKTAANNSPQSLSGSGSPERCCWWLTEIHFLRAEHTPLTSCCS